MLHASCEVWVITIAALIIGICTVKRIVSRHRFPDGGDAAPEETYPLEREHDIQHRALMFLMNQRTDSMLSALSRTIEKERQKLGIVVRKPSGDETVDASPAKAMPVPPPPPSMNQRVLHLARSGMTVSTMARQLRLPEAEIDLVVRLNAA